MVVVESSMNRAISSIAFAGGLLVAMQALADDSMSRGTMSKRQLMTQCMQKQKSADVTMSQAQMKRICKDQLKNLVQNFKEVLEEC